MPPKKPKSKSKAGGKKPSSAGGKKPSGGGGAVGGGGGDVRVLELDEGAEENKRLYDVLTRIQKRQELDVVPFSLPVPEGGMKAYDDSDNPKIKEVADAIIRMTNAILRKYVYQFMIDQGQPEEGTTGFIQDTSGSMYGFYEGQFGGGVGENFDLEAYYDYVFLSMKSVFKGLIEQDILQQIPKIPFDRLKFDTMRMNKAKRMLESLISPDAPSLIEYPDDDDRERAMADEDTSLIEEQMREIEAKQREEQRREIQRRVERAQNINQEISRREEILKKVANDVLDDDKTKKELEGLSKKAIKKLKKQALEKARQEIKKDVEGDLTFKTGALEEEIKAYFTNQLDDDILELEVQRDEAQQQQQAQTFIDLASQVSAQLNIDRAGQLRDIGVPDVGSLENFVDLMRERGFNATSQDELYQIANDIFTDLYENYSRTIRDTGGFLNGVSQQGNLFHQRLEQIQAQDTARTEEQAQQVSNLMSGIEASQQALTSGIQNVDRQEQQRQDIINADLASFLGNIGTQSEALFTNLSRVNAVDLANRDERAWQRLLQRPMGELQQINAVRLASKQERERRGLVNLKKHQSNVRREARETEARQSALAELARRRESRLAKVVRKNEARAQRREEQRRVELQEAQTGEFLSGIEQRGQAIEKRLSQQRTQDEQRRANEVAKDNAIKKTIDSIRTLREDESITDAYKIKTLYQQLANEIKHGLDEDKIGKTVKTAKIADALRRLLGLEGRGTTFPGETEPIPAVEGRPAVPPVPAVPAQPAVEGLSPVDAYYAGSGYQPYLQNIQKSLAQDRFTRKAKRGGGSTTTYQHTISKILGFERRKGKQGIRFRNKTTNEDISLEEMARRITQASIFKGREFADPRQGDLVSAMRYHNIWGLKQGGRVQALPGRMAREAVEGRPGVPGIPEIPAVPAQPGSIAKGEPRILTEAEAESRFLEFITNRAKDRLNPDHYRAKARLEDKAQVALARIRAKAEGGEPFRTYEAGEEGKRIADVARGVEGYSTVRDKGAFQIGEIPGKDFEVQAFSTGQGVPGVVNPAQYQASRRALKEAELVEPEFKKIMGDLAQAETLQQQKGIKPADGTTERALGLRNLYKAKKEKYLQDWSADGTTVKTLGFDTYTQAELPANRQGLSNDANADVALANTYEALIQPRPEQALGAGGRRVDAVDESLRQDVGKERKQYKFSEADKQLRNKKYEQVAKDIIYLQRQAQSAVNKVGSAQQIFDRYGVNTGGTAGGPIPQLVSVSDTVSAGLPEAQSLTPMSASSPNVSRGDVFPYFGVGALNFQFYHEYFNDLLEDHNQGKMPVQLITDTYDNTTYLYPTINSNGLAPFIKNKNGVGEIASVQKLFMGGRPVYWAHIKPHTSKVAQGGYIQGGFQTSGLSSNDFRIKVGVNPLIDIREVGKEPLRSQVLKVGDTVDVIRGFGSSSTEFSPPGGRVVAVSGGYKQPAKTTVGTAIQSLDDITIQGTLVGASAVSQIKAQKRTGKRETLLDTEADRIRRARRLQRNASIGLPVAGRSKTLIYN